MTNNSLKRIWAFCLVSAALMAFVSSSPAHAGSLWCASDAAGTAVIPGCTGTTGNTFYLCADCEYLAGAGGNCANGCPGNGTGYGPGSQNNGGNGCGQRMFPNGTSVESFELSDASCLSINITGVPVVGPPAITSAGSATGTVGSAFGYQIVASNSPTSYSASGLPAPLTINTVNGLISGTPSSAGTFNVTLSATNGIGTGTKVLSLTINSGPPGVPSITSALSATATVNQPFSYQITASNGPFSSYGASNLPAGLAVNTTSGLISGTPTVLGPRNVGISATNVTGTGSNTLALNVVSGPVLTRIRITPDGIGVPIGSNQKFTATGLDQNGNPIALGPITWTVSGGGSVTSAGVFKTSTAGTSIVITATVGSVTGTATIRAFQASLDGAYAWPVPYKPSLGHNAINFTGLGDDTTIKVYTITGELVKELHNAPGQTTLSWTPVTNNDGQAVVSGVYIYQMTNPYSEKRGKLVIVR